MSNSENNKRIAKNTLLLYFRMGITMLVTLYTSRIILKALGIQDYGIYNIVGGIVAMFTFLNGSLASSTSRFITYELGRNDFTALKKVFRSAYTIHLILVFVVFILAETIGLWFVINKLVIPSNRLSAAIIIYQFSVITCLISILQIPYNAEIIAHENMKFYAYLGLFDAFTKLSIAFLITISSYDKLESYGFLLMITSIFIFVIYATYCKKMFKEISNNLLFEKKRFKEMLSFSGWSLFGYLSWILKLQGINILLNLFFGPSINAARGVAMQINNAISGFTQNFTVAINPQIIKSYAIKDEENMMKLLFRGSKMSFLLLLVFAVPLLIEIEQILNIWLVKVPEYSAIFARLVIINTLIESFTHTIGASVQATGKIKLYNIVIGGIIMLNLPLSYILLKMGYPPHSTLFVSLILAIISNAVRIIILDKLINSFSWKVFLKQVYIPAFLVAMISFSFPFCINCNMNRSILRLIVVIISSVLTTLLAIWFLGFNKNERNFIKDVFIGKIRSVKKN